MSCQGFPWPQRGKLKHTIDMKKLVEWLAYTGFLLLAIGAWIYLLMCLFIALFNRVPSINL